MSPIQLARRRADQAARLQGLSRLGVYASAEALLRANRWVTSGLLTGLSKFSFFEKGATGLHSHLIGFVLLKHLLRNRRLAKG